MTIPEEIEQLKIKLEHTADEREQAEVLMELLKKFTIQRIYAIQIYIDKLFLLAKRLDRPLYEARALLHLSSIEIHKGNYNDAFITIQKALSLFQIGEDKSGIADSYGKLGNLFLLQSKYTEAQENFLLAIRYKTEIQDKLGIAGGHVNLGLICYEQGNYTEALRNYLVALKLSEEIGDRHHVAALYGKIGSVYSMQGNYPEALKNHFASLKMREEMGEKYGIASCYDSIGRIHEHQGNYPEALKKHFAALEVILQVGDKQGISASYGNIGNCYLELKEYDKSLQNHLVSLDLKKELGNKSDISHSYVNIGSIYESRGNLSVALENYLMAFNLQKEIGNQYGITHSSKNIGDVYFKTGNYTEALNYLFLSFQISEKIGHKEMIVESSLSIYNIYKSLADFQPALEYFEKYHNTEKEILGEESTKQLNQLSFTHNLEQKEKDLEIEQLRNVELKKERDRSESLLLNILPQEVAEELKAKGSADAKLFDDVTVLFTDFKSFTKVSERLTPQQLVDELNVCFSAFDAIMTKHNIEKIKTVGDAYLAVSGLPLPTATHATDVVNAAIDIREFIKQRKAEKGDDTFDIRIGVHSGSVVAGIVGVKKFAYDIWGDTVNTAARMEQNSEPGKINISEATYALVKDKFSCQYRGEIDAKNKGKLKMYFVESSLI